MQHVFRGEVWRGAEIGLRHLFREFRKPCREEFAEPTRWSLLNAFTAHATKYSPGRADVCYRGLTDLFGLDGNRFALWG